MSYSHPSANRPFDPSTFPHDGHSSANRRSPMRTLIGDVYNSDNHSGSAVAQYYQCSLFFVTSLTYE
jgi:hypothetical protein